MSKSLASLGQVTVTVIDLLTASAATSHSLVSKEPGTLAAEPPSSKSGCRAPGIVGCWLAKVKLGLGPPPGSPKPPEYPGSGSSARTRESRPSSDEVPAITSRGCTAWKP